MASSVLNRNSIARRRSNRMALNAPIGLTGEDGAKASFSLKANATSLNRHGAAVQVNHELPVGATLVVRNNRGTQIPARVVTQISVAQGMRTYGIEFAEDTDRSRSFWGINFPSNA